jgi:predicted N-acetyltransferase YhbS
MQDPTPSVSAPDWDVRPYQPGDEEQLVALYARVFGRPRSLEFWRWKLKGRDAPFETVWVAATDKGQIIGQYGGIPLRVQLHGQVVPAVHAVEAMTDPEFRRKGMLTRLGSAAHQGWADAGQVVVLGLPNEQWGTRNRALGYVTLFPLAWLRFPLHIERVVAQRGRVPGPLAGPARAVSAVGGGVWRQMARRNLRRKQQGAALTVEAVTTPDRAFDQLWQSLARHYAHFVVRDAAWVQWRYLAAPEQDYRVLLARAEGLPVGYIAYRLVVAPERVTGYIADLFLAPDAEAVAAALIEAALDDLSARGAGMVVASGVPGSALHRLLRGLRFLAVQLPFNFELVPLAPQVDPVALADPLAWHLTAGDFDVV